MSDDVAREYQAVLADIRAHYLAGQPCPQLHTRARELFRVLTAEHPRP
jgi:hypothetical protein